MAARPLRGRLVLYSTSSALVQSTRISWLNLVGTSGVGHPNRYPTYLHMIRDANESDLPCLAAAMVRLQEAHARAFPDFYRRFDTDDALSHLSGLLSRSDAIVRVAVHEGTVIGHVVFLIEMRPESLFTHSQRYGHIAQIEVEPDFRHRGYGRSLLADCERLAASHDLHRIGLDVSAFNSSAKSFFQANGYSDFGYKMSRSV